MSIAPNSTIKILKNVPLDNTHKHTIYFSNRSNQTTYFNGLVQYTLDHNTYQRVQKGVCRVGIKADNLYTCNYMMFQNTNYGSKWFYAFITAVEYVNDNVSDISFEIDVMQTWLVGTNLDYQLGKQFIERQHARTDAIGDNIVGEPVELGEYVNTNYEILKDLSDTSVIIGTTYIPNDITHLISYDNLFSIPLYAVKTIDMIRHIIVDHDGHESDLRYMYMCPSFLVNNDAHYNTRGTITGGYVSSRDNPIGTGIDGTESFFDRTHHSSYTPKNKKLYTYPYNFYTVDNGCGDVMALRYEFFNDNIPVFTVMGTFIQPVSVTCYPRQYKGSGSEPNFRESITINNFPQCSWVTDYYSLWMGQQGTATLINSLRSAVMSSRGGIANAPLMNMYTDLKVADYQASVHSDISNGKNSANMLMSQGDLKFRGCRTHITSNMCECIDNFFTRFGYAFNIIGEPNISSRPHWNYVKTKDCTIKGSIPMEDMREINNIFDRGITFWKNGSEVGDYSLNNSPT